MHVFGEALGILMKTCYTSLFIDLMSSFYLENHDNAYIFGRKIVWRKQQASLLQAYLGEIRGARHDSRITSLVDNSTRSISARGLAIYFKRRMAALRPI